MNKTNKFWNSYDNMSVVTQKSSSIWFSFLDRTTHPNLPILDTEANNNTILQRRQHDESNQNATLT